MTLPALLLSRCRRLGATLIALLATTPLATRAETLVNVSTLAGRPQFGNADGSGADVGFANPFGLAADASGNVFVADTLNHTIRRIAPDGVVTTIAGKPGAAGSADGPALQARFHSPQGLAVDAAGTIFVADTGNCTIRAISPAGDVRTIAGEAGVLGDADGPGAAARFRNPTGLAVDGAGTVFVTDSFSATIRTVSPAGEVQTLAGTAGEFGDNDGIGSAARFKQPVGVAVDGTGHVYVTDATTATIRAIDAAGHVTTLAGKSGATGSADGAGSDARFNFPRGIAVDGSGNIHVADAFNHTIRLVQPSGVVSTLAGQAGQEGDADGPVLEARFSQPLAVTVGAGGMIYVSDLGACTIRTIDAGEVRTLAGAASSGDRDGPAADARFDGPSGIARDEHGNLYVADTGNNTIRQVSPTGMVRTLAGQPGQFGHVDGPGDIARFSSPNGIAVDGDGNVYVADEGNRAVRKITPDGTTSTLATESDGLVDPTSVAIDASGNLYVTDRTRHTIEEITPAGDVATFAGTAFQRGSEDGTGAAARFDDPYRIAIDDAGTLYVADQNGTIRKVSPTAEVTTLAGDPASRSIRDGTGRDARFLLPDALAVDGLGNLFVADGGSTIRQVTPAGQVTTLAGRPGLIGGVDGPGPDARFALPGGIAVDRAAHLYIADTANNLIREAVSATRLVNLSIRGRVGTADQTPIMGFVVSEGAPKPVLVRSIGPGLVPAGVTDATADPRLQFFNAAAHPIEENDDWGGIDSLRQVFDAVGAFSLDPASRDAALFTTLLPGLYSVHTAAAQDAGGVALLEVYDADADATSRLINLSARLYAGEADETLIAGFVLAGTMPKQLLVRIAGPSLAPLGVGSSGLLLDPKLTLFQEATPIGENDDWGATDELKAVFRTVGAFDFGPDASKDAALVTTLQPGVYTVHATAATPGPGVALIEIYEVP